MMTTLLRMACLLVAGVVFGSWWLAVALVLLAIPLPWIALHVANDQAPPNLAATTSPTGDTDH
jgi:Protein of unknown function (DUF3099)